MKWLIITTTSFDFSEEEYGFEGSLDEAEEIAWEQAYSDFFNSYGVDDIVNDQYPDGYDEDDEESIYFECEELIYDYIGAFVEEFEGTEEEWSNLKKLKNYN